VVSLPRSIGDLICHPRTGILHAPGQVFNEHYVIDPFTRTFTKHTATAFGHLGGVWEEATGQMLVVDQNSKLLRMTETGDSTLLLQPPAGSMGYLHEVDLVPSPVRYGKGRAGDFGADWDLPPRSSALANATDLLPYAGNQNFALSVSSGGWLLLGVIALGADRTPDPGIEIVDDLVIRGRQHLDPGLMFAFLPVFGTSTARLPLPIPPGTAGFSLYTQGFFFDDSNIVYTPGLRTTIIE
jgi:hypothetical protein